MNAQSACDWRTSCLVGGFIGLATWVTFLGYIAVRIGLNTPTRGTGDEPDYDTIAWELSQGRGYRLNFVDPEFRRPYDAATATSEIFRLESQRIGVTTYRPPLFPYAVAAGNALFGRQFWFMRAWNLAAMAACCGLLTAVVHRRFGLRIAIASAAVFVIADPRPRLYGSAFLTEAMAAFEVAMLTVLFVYGVRGRMWQTCSVGLVTGLAILTRSVVVLWIPGLSAALVVGLYAGSVRPGWQKIAAHIVAYLATVVVVLLPWSIWNCRTLGRFMPLGAQGAVELSAGWSDRAWELKGEWRSPQPPGYFENAMATGLPIVELERQAADESVRNAKEWVLANPLKAAGLFAIKIIQEFRPKDWSQGVILLLAIIGAVKWNRVAGVHSESPRLRTIGIMLVAAQSVAVGLTWTVPESRFVVPLLLVEHLFAAAGLAVIATSCGYVKRPNAY